MAAALLESPVDQATPPALTEQRKDEIRQALKSFTEFNAKNARAALASLSTDWELNDSASMAARNALGKARDEMDLASNVIDGHEALAAGKLTYAGNLAAYAPDPTMRTRGHDAYDNIANPLEFNPIEKAIYYLTASKQENDREMDELKTKGLNYREGRWLSHTEEASQRLGTIIGNYESANIRYKAAFSDLRNALAEKKIKPDEIIRYNNELKEKVILEAVTDFSKKDEAGNSNAEIARKALKTFADDREHSSRLSYGAANGLDALDAMGRGAKANDEHLDRWSVTPYGMSEAIASMETIIKETAQKSPGKAQQLEDAKEAFVIATRDIMKSFEENAVSPDDLKRYNAKLAQREERRQKDFKDLGSKDKIVQFVTEKDGANLGRYQAIIDGIEAVLKVKDQIPGMERGHKVKAPQYIEANTPFLNDVRKYYTNKKEGLKAVAEGRDLKPEEFKSLANYPVVDVDRNALESGGVYTFKLQEKRPRLERGELDQGIMPLVMDTLNALDMQSAEPDIIRARKALSFMRVNAYGHNEVNKESLVDVEKKHDIVPEKFHNLLADGYIEVLPAPSKSDSAATSAPSAAPTASGMSPISPSESLIITPTEEQIEKSTAAFAGRFSGDNKRELLRGKGALSPLQQRIAERLSGDGKEKER